MPPVEKHVQSSLKRTGKEYRELHEWIDHKDMATKAQRHDITKIYEYGSSIKTQYGDEGLQEYVQHIHDDVKAKFEHLQEDLRKSMAQTLEYFGVR